MQHAAYEAASTAANTTAPTPTANTASTTNDTTTNTNAAHAVSTNTTAPTTTTTPNCSTEDLWFQPEEYEEIKRKTMALIRAVQDNDTGGVTYCTRGLERYFAVNEVQDKRNDAWDSVLDEQDLQRDHAVYDDTRLSAASARATQRSAREAIERGKNDEDAIERYIKKTRKVCRAYSMPF